MKRIFPALPLLLLVIFAGCQVEPRTKILVSDITNNSTGPAYVAISSKFFYPIIENNQTLQTSVIPSATTTNLVLLDTSQLESSSYYLYIAVDLAGDGLNDGDRLLPVPRIQLEAGDEVDLRGIVVDDDAGLILSPSSWSNEIGNGTVFIENKLTRPVSDADPLYFVAKNSTDFSTTFSSPDYSGYIRISDPAVTSVTILTQPYSTEYICIFMNLDEGDTTPSYIPSPTTGDYANQTYSVTNFFQSVYANTPPSIGTLNETLNDFKIIQP